LFGETFGYSFRQTNVVGDVSTHFFDEDGMIQQLHANNMCASEDDLKQAKKVIAIACGDDKISAISGALKSGLIDTLITDEHTARQLLARR
jgi:lsr operon transcriptional repressor